ncbi:MAG: 2-hydroxyglutaryl-CoA dehydratase [Deltaproteobacteria bacterium]|jgi:(R)-2-hydroxyacyl-CoA dehydratese activating ATPase|nr:2-hydroxyglutaryl-CoA dehydratase [Deltaproteobacteria bacterium]MBT4267877.1 2-hydroxyglutaryl-CoA dehydratase [Deltaproteobacteria bacterium]MBT4638550.1 2-hydroxyglutaryl-CoA dehydratase [Deltaproteobacteria bacterium]MBT6503200.1 2-hydroxyglutaryl-CoA dehydratase [Deltaproteobacteria bacterium]MBT7153612.1 2-hydroxyglutaryl-CoA dehydratase [Deltaproteobacteria bacterium]
MIVAGCDVGSLSAEAVILNNESIVAYDIIRVRPRPEQSAEDVMGTALSKSGLSYDDIDFCVSTGYGRENIPFAQGNVSEISCHGKGAQWLIPSVRTIIDVGGQDCKAITVDENGDLVNFLMNDKCASGTGRFLEGVSKTLGISLEELAALSLKGEKELLITSVCSVFAETEALSLINEGETLSDVAAGISLAMAKRINSLVKRIGIKNDVCFTGGVAKNPGVVKAIEKILDVNVINLPEDPQIIGALGAALFARERAA